MGFDSRENCICNVHFNMPDDNAVDSTAFFNIKTGNVITSLFRIGLVQSFTMTPQLINHTCFKDVFHTFASKYLY